MPTPIAILAAFLGTTGMLTGVYWLLVRVRMKRIARFSPRLADGLDRPPASGKVSVIVPAHDEERVIERLVTGVLGQIEVDFELIVVLDRCTDRTLERLQAAAGDDERVRVIELDSCPADWAGKCHAAAMGAEVASGDWLLFTDADVAFEPEVLRAATAATEAEDVDLLSAWTSLSSHDWWGAVVQPVAAITLLRMFPPDRVNNLDRPRSFANGQFLLFRRTTYDRIGGHESVKDSVLEDLAFAARVHHFDGRVRLVIAESMVRTDMYATLAELREGWVRIFIESAKRNLRRLLTNLILVAGSGLAPVACWAGIVLAVIVGIGFDEAWLAGGLALAGIFGLISQGTTLAGIFGRGGMPRVGVLAWTVGCLQIVLILGRAIGCLRRRRPIRWGGREYLLRPGPR